jgi:tetratricopeptide (TPR) repeat protein
MARTKTRPRRRPPAFPPPDRESRAAVAEAAAEPVSRSSRPAAIWWGALVLVLAGSLAYSNSLSNPFVFDDLLTIYSNPTIEEPFSVSVLLPPRELPVSGRPVASVSFALNHAVSDTDVRGYRVVNIAIHVLCALLLAACVRRALALPWAPPWLTRVAAPLSVGTALIWTIHPLNAEVINYVTQRTEGLMALFFLLTLYASIRAHRSPRPGHWSALAVVSCALGMGSKETMAVAPLLVLLFDRVFVFRSLGAAVRTRWPLYAGLASCWIIAAALFATQPRPGSAGFATGVSVWTYLQNQASLVLRYFALALWPHNQVAIYGWPVERSLSEVLPYAVLILALIAATLVALRVRPPLGFVGAWIFLTLAPASSVIPILTEVGAERRMYLPLMGVVLLVAVTAVWLWSRAEHHRTAASVALAGSVVLATVGLTAATSARNRDYASVDVLARQSVERYPSAVARHLLAEQLLKTGQRDEAIAYLRAALPGAPRAHFTLGVVLFEEGRLDEAIGELRAFVRSQTGLPQVVEAHGYLAKALAARQRWTEATAEFREILRLDPGNPLAAYGLADMLAVSGRPGEAIPYYRDYLESRPDDVSALHHLGMALGASGQLEDSADTFRRAMAMDPDNADVLLGLAGTLWRLGRPQDALVYAERAASLQPGNEAALELLRQLRTPSGQ